MTGLIQVDRLYSVGVVVRDLKAATLRYAEIFGIDEWDVRDFGPERITAATLHGRPVNHSFRTAIGVAMPPAGGGVALIGNPLIPVTFELIQPLSGESPFKWFGFQRGQGISHLTLAVRDEAEFELMRGRLENSGIHVGASFTVDSCFDRHFIDTRAALGGWQVEVQVPLRPDASADVAVTVRWNHAGTYTRPEGVGPLTVHGVNHFGVVVDDVAAALERYDELLGMSQWPVREWRPGIGARGLGDPYYRGEKVDHAYISALQSIADFGFEIVQPTSGPSHYNREFRDRFGPGVHHMLLNVTTEIEEWDRTREWLATTRIPVVMGADLFGGAAAFCYYDTSDALGGYLVEAILMRDQPSSENLAPDFLVDFASLTTQR